MNYTIIIPTIALAIIPCAPAIAKPATSQLSYTLATEAPISDLPNPSNSFVPPNRLQDITPSATRGIICKPGQDMKDCDDRTPMRSQDYPWSAIGRLQIGEDGHCTATLIDKNWLLTNAHCVVDRKTHTIVTEAITFSPNLIDGKLQSDDDRATVTKIIIGTDFQDSDKIPNPKDWAMLKIDRPLGEKYGSIGWKAIPSSLLIKNKHKFSIAGYSYDFPSSKQYPEFTAGASFTAGLSANCSITGETDDRALIHDCDTRAGSSGSAVIAWIKDEPYIIGINSAERSNRFTGIGYENYAVNVNHLDTWLIKQKRR